MTFQNDEMTWLDIIDAIDLCLDHDVFFNTEQNPNAPPNLVARQCVDIENPDKLTERQHRIIINFILPRLEAFECVECSTKLRHAELATWFNYDQRCTACAHRTQKIRKGCLRWRCSTCVEFSQPTGLDSDPERQRRFPSRRGHQAGLRSSTEPAVRTPPKSPPATPQVAMSWPVR